MPIYTVDLENKEIHFYCIFLVCNFICILKYEYLFNTTHKILTVSLYKIRSIGL